MGCVLLSTVDVVISVFSIDRAKDVVDCIASLWKQTLLPKNVIVVLDPDPELISHYRNLLDSSVKLVISGSFGLSVARNEGINNSSSEIVAFIDDDAVADSNWLKNLVSNFADPSVIGVGGQILPVWPKQKPEWFPEELYWIVGCSYKGLPLKRAPIRNPIGCNMAFRRSVFEKAGYFSTETGRVGNKLMGHDDTEFGIRALSSLSGTSIMYDPQAIVWHRVSENRVSINYVLRRSYSEGFSKAYVVDTPNSSEISVEKDYLKKIVYNTPKLSLTKAITLWLSAFTVVIGYLNALITLKLDFGKKQTQ